MIQYKEGTRQDHIDEENFFNIICGGRRELQLNLKYRQKGITDIKCQRPMVLERKANLFCYLSQFTVVTLTHAQTKCGKEASDFICVNAGSADETADNYQRLL